MEPSPPRKPKDLRFYEAPDHVQTSSKIINQARQSLRSLPTSRPFTPREDQRRLFGKTSSRNPENRPPSAISIGSRHFEDCNSRPVSGTRLSPIDKGARTSTDGPSIVPKPPPDPNRPITRKGSRSRIQHQSSVDGGAKKDEGMRRVSSYSGSLNEETEAQGDAVVSLSDCNSRRVHSGPKERTQTLNEGSDLSLQEMSPRSASLHDISIRKEIRRKLDSGYDSRGGSGSAGKRDSSETEEEASFYNKYIGPIVEDMAAQAKEKDTARLLELSRKLYLILEKEKLLGKACKRRSAILKTVFKLLDVDEPRLILRLAKLILSLKVSGNNLINVSKLVFKVAKNEENDQLFMDEEITEVLVRSLKSMDPSSTSDALVYCLGTLKFLSGNTDLLKLLTHHGCVEILAHTLQAVTSVKTEDMKSKEQIGHVLVQLTASLRNLADSSSSRDKFLQTNLIQELCVLMELFSADADLMLNVSRIFSKLTLHHDCCTVLSSQSSCFESFLELLNKHKKKEDLVVRISFILGNLTAKSEESRLALFKTENAFESLLDLFKTYIEIDFKKSQAPSSRDSARSPNTPSKGPPKTEDVLIKVIRVIANLSISEQVGPVIAAHEKCLDWLLSIVDAKDISKSEDLVLNTVATINNLSYYPDSSINKKMVAVADSLLKLLVADKMDGMVEASRVFGNLTRQKVVRDFLAKNKVTEIMVTLLDSNIREVVYTACGVLINMMVDDDRRHILSQENGIAKLIEVLRDFGRNDWQLASLVCQILWNYSSRITSCNACFGEDNSLQLSDLLIEYLDEESALDVSHDLDDDMQDYVREMWEVEFCPVAQQLLKRIETHQSEFEPLEAPSVDGLG